MQLTFSRHLRSDYCGWGLFVMTFLAAPPSLGGVSAPAPPSQSGHQCQARPVMLDGRLVLPSDGPPNVAKRLLRRSPGPREWRYGIAQCEPSLSLREARERLTAANVSVRETLTDNSFVVSLATPRTGVASVCHGCCVWPLRPEWKLSTRLSSRRDTSTTDDDSVPILVQFHGGEPLTPFRATKAVTESSRLCDQFDGKTMFALDLRIDELDTVTVLDAVRRIDLRLDEFIPLASEVEARRACLRVMDVPASFEANSSRVRIAVFDTGIPPWTPAFSRRTPDGQGSGTRVTRIGTWEGHGARVAELATGNGCFCDGSGALIGPCPNPELAAPAPTAELSSYWPDACSPASYVHASADSDVALSNHSYVQSCDGEYDHFSAREDRWIRGDAMSRGRPMRALPVVRAAGNGGARQQKCSVTPWRYSTIVAPSKNAIVVGAVQVDVGPGGPDDGRVRLWMGSSAGPTRDGRLKPDIVAPGCTGTDPLSTDGPPTLGKSSVGSLDWAPHCGTSWASAFVSGIATRIAQSWRSRHGAFPSNSTLKAALVQGAVDIAELRLPDSVTVGGATPRTYPGPDFLTGFGLVNASDSYSLLESGRLIQGELTRTGETQRFCFELPEGSPRLRVTLAWDDPAAKPDAIAADGALVHDLDLKVFSPRDTFGKLTWRPLVVRSADLHSPEDSISDPGPAEEDSDSVNNVEQVTVSWPVPGVWIAEIKATNLDTKPPQRFSLAADATIIVDRAAGCSDGHSIAPDGLYPGGIVVTWPPPEEGHRFAWGEFLGSTLGLDSEESEPKGSWTVDLLEGPGDLRATIEYPDAESSVDFVDETGTSTRLKLRGKRPFVLRASSDCGRVPHNATLVLRRDPNLLGPVGPGTSRWLIGAEIRLQD